MSVDAELHGQEVECREPDEGDQCDEQKFHDPGLLSCVLSLV
jgi:hypothetical protein